MKKTALLQRGVNISRSVTALLAVFLCGIICIQNPVFQMTYHDKKHIVQSLYNHIDIRIKMHKTAIRLDVFCTKVE